MISSIVIEGFQIHEHYELKLDKNITVFVGDNDVGKTAIVRALKWLLLNIWDGKADQMTTWGHDVTQVSAKIDKHLLVRRKAPGENVYLLDGEVFQAVGAGKVPQKIAQLVNMTEENFQEQLDPAFWFHLTAGQVARSLNKIVHLDSIDTSLDRVAKDLRQAKEEVRSTEQRLSEAREIKCTLDWVMTANEKLTEAERIAEEMAIAEAQIAKLATILTNATETAFVRKAAASVLTAGEEAVAYGKAIKEKWSWLRNLDQTLQSLQNQEERVCDLKKKLDKAQERLEKQKGSSCPTCGRAYK